MVLKVPGGNEETVSEVVDPLDAVIGFGDRSIRQAAFLNKDISPDEFSKNKHDAEQANVSPGIFRYGFTKNELTAIGMAETARNWETIKTSGPLMQWGSNPDNYAIAKDDFKNLKSISDYAQSLDHSRESDSYLAFPFQLGKSLYGGTMQAQIIWNALQAAELGGDPREQAEDIVRHRQRYASLFHNPAEYQQAFLEAMMKEGSDINKAYSEFMRERPELENRNIARWYTKAKYGAATIGQTADMISALAFGHTRGTMRFIAEMFPLSIPALGGRAAGTALGTTLGLAAGPGAPVASLILGAMGFLAGSAGQSVVEVPAKVLESFERRGIDLDSVESLTKAFSDKELMDEVRSESRRGGITTAVLENLLFLRAGKRLAKLKANPKLVRYGTVTGAPIRLRPPRGAMVRAFSKDTAEQMFYGASAATIGQAAAFGVEELDLSEFAMEFLSDLAESPVDVVIGEGRHISQRVYKGESVIPGRASYFGVTEGGVFRPTVFSEARLEALNSINSMIVLNGAKDLMEAKEVLKESKVANRGMHKEIASLLEIAAPNKFLYFDRDDFADFARENQINPVEFLSKVTPRGEEYYQNSIDFNSRIAIPANDFITNVSEEYYQDLVSISRQSENGPSVPEAVNLLQTFPSKMKELSERAARNEEELEVIRARLEKDLVKRKRPKELARLESQAAVAGIGRLAESAGLSPAEFDKKFKISAKKRNEFLKEIKRLRKENEGLFRDIDKIRNPPKAKKPISLSQRIRQLGGIKSSDPLVGDVQGFNNLIRKNGRGLGDLAKVVTDEGFLPEGAGHVDLINALQEEASGNPVYAQDVQINELDELKSQLEKAGIDVNKMSNEEILASLQGDEFSLPKRGRINIETMGETVYLNIDFLKGADKSTFIHELGHAFLTIMDRLSRSKNPTSEIQELMSTARELLGLKEGEAIGEFHQEAFAEWTERMFQEKTAPSSKLLKLFEAFRKWITEVYYGLRETRIPFTPEVRDFMARILATDEEIAQMKLSDSFGIGIPETLMDGESKTKSERLESLLVAEANKRLGAHNLANYARGRDKFLRNERQKIRKELGPIVNSNRNQIVLALLSKGTSPDGSPLPDGINAVKIDPDSVPKGLKFKKEMLEKGGANAEALAGMFGYESAEQMARELANTKSYRTALTEAVEAEMLAVHGDPLLDPNMPEEVVAAMHNHTSEEILLTAMEILAEKANERKPNRKVLIASLRRKAQEYLGGVQIKDLRPYSFYLAEVRSAKDAGKFIANNRMDKALKSKREQLLNHELYRMAKSVKDQYEKDLKYIQKTDNLASRKRIGSARTTEDGGILYGGEEHLAQLDNLRKRFNLPSNPKIKRFKTTRSLSNWQKDPLSIGFDVEFTDFILSGESRDYRQLTVDEFKEVSNTFRTIVSFSRHEFDMMQNEKFQKLADAREALVNEAKKYHKIKKEPKDLDPDLRRFFKTQAQKIEAWHTKMEFLFNYMDGGADNPLGTWFQTFFKPLADAEDMENVMLFEARKKIDDIVNKYYSKEERVKWAIVKTEVPELSNEKIKNHFTKQRLLAILLNQGNVYNQEAVREFYGWSQENVNKALFRELGEKDFKFAQDIWNMIDEYWPHIEKLERKLNGAAPDKVKSDPIETPWGTFKGGYYPLAFDGRLDRTVRELDEKKSTEKFFGGSFASSHTSRGHAINRTYHAGKPVKLDLSILSNHLASVIHDITHREAVIDLNRLINDSEIREVIESVAGEQMYRQLKPWLRNVANDRQVDPNTPGLEFINHMKNGVTTVALGAKISTAALQAIGYTLTVKEIGGRYAAKGFRSAYGDPRKINEVWNFITERSDMMKFRPNNYDRDIRSIVNTLGLASSKPGFLSASDVYLGDVRNSFFYFIAYMDLGVSIPSWMGAYMKAMDGNQKGIAKGDENAAIAFADSVVRKSQAAGAAKDLAAVQRGHPLFKMFTLFYTSLSSIANQLMSIPRQFKIDRNMPRLIASVFWAAIAAPIAESFLRGRSPGLDDDPEEWAKWALTQVSYYPGQAFIGARDMIWGLERYFSTGQKKFTPSPLIGVGEDILGSLVVGAKILNLKDGDITRSEWKDLVYTGGYMLHLPSGQLWKSSEYFYDWMVGNENPDNVMEGVWRTIYLGKEYKK